MSKSKVVLALALALTMLPTGCATIFSGGQPVLNVDVEDPTDDLTVIVQGINNGDKFVRHDPSFSVPLSRGTDYVVTVKAPNFETESVAVHRTIRSVFWVNFCCLSAFWLGMLADFATGNMWDPDRTQVTFRLEKARRSRSSMVLPIEMTAGNGQAKQLIEIPVHARIAAR